MSRGLTTKINWGLDSIEEKINDIENEEIKGDLLYEISFIRDYLGEIESEVDDINRCLERII